ncbi:hypothetical protein [Pseudoalteromonas sp. BDTF-M6]|uniref:hypothetical protein n=1 Tax=Pseudoalteromonas sp. BDTF-M6 TaxID=2796132 RepID=UPI001BAF039F|nr:hypothetical protein [Pseudoalteromonas sp. BDTF-M6]MBS3797216.1 hypothetical protein [Pseudoalteromonas sp. BDTF-M6]
MQKYNLKYNLLFVFALFALTGLLASQHLFTSAANTSDQYSLTIKVDTAQTINHDSDDDHDPEYPLAPSIKQHALVNTPVVVVPSVVLNRRVITVAQQRAPPYFS